MVTRADEVSAATRKWPPRSNHKLLVDAQAFRRSEDCEESRSCPVGTVMRQPWS